MFVGWGGKGSLDRTSLDVSDVPTPIWPDTTPSAPLDTEAAESSDTGVAEGRGLTCVDTTQVAIG